MSPFDEPDGFSFDALPKGDAAELARCVDELLAEAERVRADCVHAISEQVWAAEQEAMQAAADVAGDLAGQVDKLLELAEKTVDQVTKPLRREAAELILDAARVAMDHGYQLQDLAGMATDLVMDTIPPLVPYANLVPDHDQPEETADAPGPQDGADHQPPNEGSGAGAGPGPVGAPGAAPRGAGQGLPPIQVIPECPPGYEPHVYPSTTGPINPTDVDLGLVDPVTGTHLWATCKPHPNGDGGPPPGGGDGPPPPPPPGQEPCPPPPCQPICPQEPPPPEPVTCDWVVVLGKEGDDKPPKPFDDPESWECEELRCEDGKKRWACHKKECSPGGEKPECPPPDEELPKPELPPPPDAEVLCGANDWPNALGVAGWTSERSGCGPGAVGMLRDIEALVSAGWNALFNVIPRDWEMTWVVMNGLHIASLDLARLGVNLIDSGLCMSGCLTQSWTGQLWRVVFGWLENWVGYRNVPVERGLTYAENWCCPNVVPDVGNLLRMFQTNQLTGAEYLNAVRSQGISLTWAGKLLQAHHWRLTPDMVVDLWRRKVLDDEQRDELLHQVGIWDERERRAYVELGKWLIPPTDLIRLMVRDVFDPAIVGAEQLGKEFNEKYNADAQKMGEAVGISREQMLLLWMGHWRYPSPGQLFTMLHRNRPGRVADELVVTMEDVLRQLGIDDLAPIWRAKLASISYAVIRLVDLRRIYFADLIDDEELVQRLMDRGNTEADARLIAAYWAILKKQQSSCGLNKLRSSRGYVAYRDGYANKDGATRMMELQTGCDLSEHPEVWEFATLERRAALVKRTVTNVSHAIGKGVMSPEQGRAILLGLGLELEQVIYHEQNWRLPDPKRPREAGIAEHCEWVERGIETADDFYQALLRMNFPPVTALRIIRNCGYEITQHAQQAAAQAEKRRLAAEKKAAPRRGRRGTNGTAANGAGSTG
jgi:hypothetical protein